MTPFLAADPGRGGTDHDPPVSAADPPTSPAQRRVREVAIAGASMTRFGERDAWLRDLLATAGDRCLADAGVAPGTVDHLYLAVSSGSYQAGGGLMNALAADLGLSPAHAEGVSQTSASGGAGLYAAWRSVALGEADVALLVGGEKMTHRSTTDLTELIADVTHPVEYKHGITLPAFAGLTARRYLDRFDAPREVLAQVAVKNHANGVHNPNAHFRERVDVETVFESPVVADPLRRYDFCPISDGSAALLLTTPEIAREYADESVRVKGIGSATDTHAVHEREDLTAMGGVTEAGNRAYEAAGIGPAAIDVAELHDMFTILELLQMEGLGFAERGEAWRQVDAGRTDLDGDLPINTSGGLKAKGHPLAASGLAQVVELHEQLSGAAGRRQVDAERGLACNVGGFGNAAVVAILERGRHG